MKHPCPGCDFLPGHVSNSVCGSDGKTYEDDCKLAAVSLSKLLEHACSARAANVSQKFDGTCITAWHEVKRLNF